MGGRKFILEINQRYMREIGIENFMKKLVTKLFAKNIYERKKVFDILKYFLLKYKNRVAETRKSRLDLRVFFVCRDVNGLGNLKERMN